MPSIPPLRLRPPRARPPWLTVAVFFLLVPGAFGQAARAQEVGDAAAVARQKVFRRVVAAIEPDGVGRPERLDQYVAFFLRELAGDPRQTAVELRATWQPEGLVRLEGHVEFQEHRQTLLGLLRYLQFREIDDRIEALPSAQLGPRRFGLVRQAHAVAYDRPEAPRRAVTDCLLGWPVFLLREAKPGRYLCHSAQGYVGFVDGESIRRVDAEELARYTGGRQVYLQADHSSGGHRLPIGARLRHVGDRGEHVVVELPSGGEILVPRAKCRVSSGQVDPRIERVIQIAQQFLGTPYVWGGKTTEGVDCSGLVQAAFRAEGIDLARDAYQQAYAGALSATRWDRGGLRRGDALYFLDATGRISHTALYLGEGRYLEAVRPVVRISSFDPADEDYRAEGDASFCFGKRLFE